MVENIYYSILGGWGGAGHFRQGNVNKVSGHSFCLNGKLVGITTRLMTLSENLLHNSFFESLDQIMWRRNLRQVLSKSKRYGKTQGWQQDCG